RKRGSRRGEDGEKTKEMRLQCRFRDHFSELPNDCVIDVLTRVNHDDLDEIGAISKKLGELSIICRSKAVKEQCSSLFIAQESATHVFLNIQRDFHRSYWMEMSPKSRSVLFIVGSTSHGNPYVTSKPETYAIPSQQEVISKTIAYRISSVSERFEFTQCMFEWICIDDNMLTLFNRFIRNGSVTNLQGRQCILSVQPNIRERFLELLLSARASTVIVQFDEEIQIVTNDFQNTRKCFSRGYRWVAASIIIICCALTRNSWNICQILRRFQFNFCASTLIFRRIGSLFLLW
ncbi:hypothetical protein PMAYCL1PPCAC_20874, partial [Pristionchus mayeri]